jgi:hypothetical protein
MTSKRHHRASAVAAALFSSLLLAGCNQTAAPPPSAAATPSSARLPEGSGCAGDIAQFKAVLKNDVDTGNVGQSVYTRASADLGRAETACAAGRDGEARALVASAKSRFGYR